MSEQLDVSQFEKNLVIRKMQRTDFDEILEIQRKSFPGMDPWELAHLNSHLDIFPEGQIVAELDGKVIASCSSLIINFDEYDDRATWSDVTDDG